MFANKRKLQQALVLSVQQVKSLHATLEDGEADAVVAHTHTHPHAHAHAHMSTRTRTRTPAAARTRSFTIPLVNPVISHL